MKLTMYYPRRTYEQASRPVWGAWIEIVAPKRPRRKDGVAPRMGRVD